MNIPVINPECKGLKFYNNYFIVGREYLLPMKNGRQTIGTLETFEPTNLTFKCDDDSYRHISISEYLKGCIFGETTDEPMEDVIKKHDNYFYSSGYMKPNLIHPEYKIMRLGAVETPDVFLDNNGENVKIFNKQKIYEEGLIFFMKHGRPMALSSCDTELLLKRLGSTDVSVFIIRPEKFESEIIKVIKINAAESVGLFNMRSEDRPLSSFLNDTKIMKKEYGNKSFIVESAKTSSLMVKHEYNYFTDKTHSKVFVHTDDNKYHTVCAVDDIKRITILEEVDVFHFFTKRLFLKTKEEN